MTERSRRRFLGAITGAGITAALPRFATASVPQRTLALTSIHTHESVEVMYWRNGQYLPNALSTLHHQLRDHRTGDVHAIDPRLLDLLVELRDAVGSSNHFDVISAYRSPRTNRMLAARSSGVAKKSLHMRGLAIDIRLPGENLRKVRDTAIDMKRGGVGYYAKSGFIHLDLGRPRTW
ncbi:MAG: hypothetical protein ACI8PT_000774 [Gammaproteobacteria bacterium]|jgi:uncharacterized protein YcbK (DUF882 family)